MFIFCFSFSCSATARRDSLEATRHSIDLSILYLHPIDLSTLYLLFFSLYPDPQKGAMFIRASYEMGRERSQSLEIAVCNTSVSNSSWKRGKIKWRKYGRNRKRGETQTLEGSKWS